MFSSNLKILISLFFVFFILYIYNLSRSVYAGDVGDLVTASFVGGVAHAPGYPLFTLLGFILSKVSFGQTVAFNVGLISAFTGALGVATYFYLVFRLTKNTLVSLLSACILGCIYPYWFYSEIAEVFAMNNLFLLLLFTFAILFYKSAEKKYFYIFSFFVGLSLTNHHTIVLVFPSLLLLTVQNFLKHVRKDYTFLLSSIVLGILGLAVYIYVPFASSHHPVINWDTVHDLKSFKQLVLREDYGTLSAGAFTAPVWSQRVVILESYLFYVLKQLTIPVVFISILGVFYLWKKDKMLMLSWIVAYVLAGPVFITYAGFPLFNAFYNGIYERFFSMSSVILLFFFPFGILCVSLLLKPYLKKESIVAIQAVFFLIPLLLFFYNFPKTNLSQVYVGDNLAKDFLSPLPPHTVLFLAGDTQLFNTWYMHYVLGVRPDVTVINMNGVSSSDFFQKERLSYIRLHPKEKNENTIVNGTITLMAEKYPVFSENEISIDKGKKWGWIPYGLVKKLYNKNEPIDKTYYLKQTQAIWKVYHIPKRSENDVALGNLSIAEIPSLYSNALLATGNYFFSVFHDHHLAYTYYQKARMADPNNFKVHAVLGTYYLTVDKSCTKAKDEITTAISLDRFQKIPYFLLYSIYKECFKDDRKASTVVKDYHGIFQEDFYTGVKESIKSL